MSPPSSTTNHDATNSPTLATTSEIATYLSTLLQMVADGLSTRDNTIKSYYFELNDQALRVDAAGADEDPTWFLEEIDAKPKGHPGEGVHTGHDCRELVEIVKDMSDKLLAEMRPEDRETETYREVDRVNARTVDLMNLAIWLGDD